MLPGLLNCSSVPCVNETVTARAAGRCLARTQFEGCQMMIRYIMKKKKKISCQLTIVEQQTRGSVCIQGKSLDQTTAGGHVTPWRPPRNNFDRIARQWLAAASLNQFAPGAAEKLQFSLQRPAWHDRPCSWPQSLPLPWRSLLATWAPSGVIYSKSASLRISSRC